MKESNEELKEWMSSLSVVSLKRIIEVDFNDYEDYAIKIAKEELNTRKDNFETDGLLAADFYESDYNKKFTEIHFKSFIDLLKNVEFEVIKNTIMTMHPDHISHIENYREVYASLLQLKPNEENIDYLNIENKDFHWNVSGEDVKTGEKYGVEFCDWKDWLAFQIKSTQVCEIGKINYVAICLITLTQYGFTEEAIQSNFQRISTMSLCENDNKNIGSIEQPIYLYKEITIDGMLERTADLKQELIKKKSVKCENSQIRPWIRFWARMIDDVIRGFILGYICIISIPNIYAFDRRYTFGYGYTLLSFLIWALMEAFFISKWGCTPGKWILNIRVQGANNVNLSYKKAIKRVILVFLYGEGLLIPLVTYIANIASYNRLMNMGIAKWDEKVGATVNHSKIENYRVVLAVFILVGIPIIMFMINRGMQPSFK